MYFIKMNQNPHKYIKVYAHCNHIIFLNNELHLQIRLYIYCECKLAVTVTQYVYICMTRNDSVILR